MFSFYVVIFAFNAKEIDAVKPIKNKNQYAPCDRNLILEGLRMGRKHDKKEEASIILEILNRIPLSKRFVSVDDILNSLASAEIDVSRRSLQRYLKQMYDCGKYGLVRDNRGNAYGYRRERTDSITDSIHLKPNECLLLRIAQEHMKYQIPGTVLKSLGFLFDAASEMLKEKGSNAKENQWLNKVCVISSSIPQMPSKVLPRIFDAVSEALYSEKKLRIEYTNMNGKTTSAVVSPLALVQQDVRLYLICQFDHFDNVVHLALHRFKKAEVTSFDAHRPEDFNLQSYIHDRHFNYSNGEWVHWILEFKSDVTAKNLEETPFNTSQKLTRKEDGTWHLEVDIQDSRMLDGWVAMWKNDAQITLSQKEYLERETDEDGE